MRMRMWVCRVSVDFHLECCLFTVNNEIFFVVSRFCFAAGTDTPTKFDLLDWLLVLHICANIGNAREHLFSISLYNFDVIRSVVCVHFDSIQFIQSQFTLLNSKFAYRNFHWNRMWNSEKSHFEIYQTKWIQNEGISRRMPAQYSFAQCSTAYTIVHCLIVAC